MTIEQKEERKQKKNAYLVTQKLKLIPLPVKPTESDLKLRAAYKLWLESAVERYGASLSPAAIQQCVAQVQAFSKGDNIVAIDIVTMNTMGYNTMAYAIDDYIRMPHMRPSVLAAKIASNSTDALPKSEVVF